MKTTLKNTRILLYISLVNILVYLVIFLTLFFNMNGLVLEILLIEFCLSFLLTLAYFVNALLFFREPTSVVAAFTMFTTLLAFNIITIAFPNLLKNNYSGWLSTLLLVTSLLAAFRLFFVKDKAIRLPFALFGLGLGFISLPRLFMLLVPAKINDGVISITGDAGSLLIVISTFFILKRIITFLKTAAENQAIAERPTGDGDISR